MKYLSLFLIFIHFGLKAQNERGVTTGLNVSFNFDNSRFTGVNKGYFDDIQEVLHYPKGFSFGGIAKFRLIRNHDLLIGVYNTRKSFSLQLDDLKFFKGNYYSIDIPIGISHKITDKKVQFSIGYGAFTSYTYKFKGMLSKELNFKNISNHGYITYWGYQTNSPFIPLDYRKRSNIEYYDQNNRQHRYFNILPFVSIDIGFKISPKFVVSLIPLFRYSIFNQFRYNFKTITSDFPTNSSVVQYGTRQNYWNWSISTILYYRH